MMIGSSDNIFGAHDPLEDVRCTGGSLSPQDFGNDFAKRCHVFASVTFQSNSIHRGSRPAGSVPFLAMKAHSRSFKIPPRPSVPDPSRDYCFAIPPRDTRIPSPPPVKQDPNPVQKPTWFKKT